jgi:hypothetical protein
MIDLISLWCHQTQECHAIKLALLWEQIVDQREVGPRNPRRIVQFRAMGRNGVAA